MWRKENITLKLKNLTSYFTGKRRIITLNLAILTLGFANIILYYSNNFVSALSYQSEVGIGFTFNPTLSVSLSSSDLIISNLTPGSTADSNSINVSVATNASYGYTLSVNASSDNLVHSNNTNTFNGIATDADLVSLTTDNTWGYSTSLDNGNTWSNYNGLSSSASSTLLDKDNSASSSVDFKIAAKAGSTQASGTYTNTITFTAVTKPTPMNLAESYFAAGKSRYKGYYTMQDMTTEICTNTEVIGEGSQTELIDIRDDKVYWATKLADGHCWMTQNLDLDLSHDTPLTSETTDLNDGSLTGAYSENYQYNSATGIIAWTPANTTRNYSDNTGTAWVSNYNKAYSLDPGNWYWDGNDDTPKCNFLDPSVGTECNNFIRNHTDNNSHLSVGNYYNWSAAIASDNSGSLKNSTYGNASNDPSATNRNPQNSICPNSWRLPIISYQANSLTDSTNEFGRLNYLYNDGMISGTNIDLGLINSPLWFVRSGLIDNGILDAAGYGGYFWSSTVYGSSWAYNLLLRNDYVNPTNSYRRDTGRSVRCLAR